MTFKDWVDLFTGGGTVISGVAAGVAAWVARTSANAAEQSSKIAQLAIEANQKIAENDWRIRLMDERMKVWQAFDELMRIFLKSAKVDREDLTRAQQRFQYAQFLFDSEIDEYLQEVGYQLLINCHHDEWLNQHLVDHFLDDVQRAEKNRRQLEKVQLEKWLIKQQKEGQRLFKKHMSLID